MLATITKVLVIIEWLLILEFMIVFGIFTIPNTIIGGAIICLLSAILLLTFLKKCTKTDIPFRQRFMGEGIPMCNPFFDLILIASFCLCYKDLEDKMRIPMTIGLICTCTDFAIWMLEELKSDEKKS